MEVIKNANGKTVCQADGKNRTVEIVHKGYKTVIRFVEDGKYDVTNLFQTK